MQRLSQGGISRADWTKAYIAVPATNWIVIVRPIEDILLEDLFIILPPKKVDLFSFLQEKDRMIKKTSIIRIYIKIT